MNVFNRGSFIIELLVYLALISLLGVGTFTWFTRSQQSLVRTGSMSNALMALYSTTDLLVRDLRQSPIKRDAWLKITPDAIIWRTLDGDVGWHVHKGTLYRTTGSYNPTSGTWKGRKRSIALQGIEKFSCDPLELHGAIEHVEIALTVHSAGAHHTIHESVYPRRAV